MQMTIKYLRFSGPKNQHICLTEDLNMCFHNFYQWMIQYFLQLNASKTEIILFGPPDVLSSIPIHGCFLSQGITIRFASSIKKFGIYNGLSYDYIESNYQPKENMF